MKHDVFATNKEDILHAIWQAESLRNILHSFEANVIESLGNVIADDCEVLVEILEIHCVVIVYDVCATYGACVLWPAVAPSFLMENRWMIHGYQIDHNNALSLPPAPLQGSHSQLPVRSRVITTYETLESVSVTASKFYRSAKFNCPGFDGFFFEVMSDAIVLWMVQITLRRDHDGKPAGYNLVEGTCSKARGGIAGYRLRSSRQVRVGGSFG
jgi:hypothetical protein